MEYSNLITTGFKNTYFKLVFTTNSQHYLINPLWTVTQFIEIMRPVICRDFNLENCEFVDTHQQNIPSENGAALIYQNNVTLASKYGDDLNVAFYIRSIAAPLVETQTTSVSSGSHQDDTQTPSTFVSGVPSLPGAFGYGELQLRCVICMTRQRNILFNPCRHMCCCSECAHNIHACPICRQVISHQIAVYL